MAWRIKRSHCWRGGYDCGYETVTSIVKLTGTGYIDGARIADCYKLRRGSKDLRHKPSSRLIKMPLQYPGRNRLHNLAVVSCQNGKGSLQFPCQIPTR